MEQVKNKKRTPYANTEVLRDATCVATPNLNQMLVIFADKYQVLLYHLGRRLARGVIFILKKEV